MSVQEALIFEVTQSNFNTSVVLNSHKLPVVVEFMGMWSGPCIQMEDSLNALAREFAGQFVFAKVDIDQQQELKQQYDIKNVPTLKIFKDGEVSRTEEGQMGQDELRELLKSLGIFRQSDALREQARHKHMQGETVEAITLLTQAIKEDPRNTRVAMDMVQIFLDINQLDQARNLYNRLPDADKLSDMGNSLLGQLTFRDLASKTEGKERLLQRISENSADLDARFDLSICLVSEHDYVSAVDELFAILQQQPEYKDGAAREMVLSLANMLNANNPELAQQFRRRLGSQLN